MPQITTMESKPCLLTVTASISRRAGGLFHSVRRLSQAVFARGIPVDVVSVSDEDARSDLPHWKPLTPHVLPRGVALAYSADLPKVLNRLVKPTTVCHLHGIWLYPSKVAMDVSQRRGVPRVISPRGMLDPWALRVSSWKKRIAGWLYESSNLRTAECLHALCDSELKAFRDYGLRNPVAVVPNGTDLPGPPKTQVTDPAPTDWGGKKILLFLGRIHPKKGLLPLVEAWKKSKADRAEWRLAIAGPNEVGHREEVQSRVAALGLTDSIRFVGPQFGSGKDAWLRRADAFVLTSHSEGFPMAVLEAMAYRLPVLLSPGCNFPQAAACGGAIETEVDVEAIQTALRSLLTMSDDERNAIGERGYALVAKDYTWEHIADRMIHLYAWLRGLASRPEFVHDGN